jgi:NTP pyrophosphatase (non-canonical NTP hydrolase)
MNATFQNYQTLAMRTAKMFPTLSDNLNHAALGIGSEIFELLEEAMEDDTRPGLHEEMGDVMWYVALACHHLGVQFSDGIPAESGEADVKGLLAHPGQFISSVKRLVVYGLPVESLRDLMVSDLHALIAFAYNVLPETNDTLEQVLVDNIAKLQKRYPDKYSDMHAEARLDKGGVDCLNS